MQNQPRLILIEGLPGAGKSTAAAFVEAWLANKGLRPRLYLEGNLDHPADPESVACLDPAALAGLLDQFPDQRQALLSAIWRDGGDDFISYRKASLPAELVERLARYDIYELPAERHTALLRRRWRQFTERAARQDDVTVFECCFLQNSITVLVGKHNLDAAAVQDHIMALAGIASPLNPCLLYLDAGEARPTLERVIAARPPEWLDFVIAYHTEQGLGKARGWQGLEGYMRFMEMRRALEKALFDRLLMTKAWIDQADFETGRQQIEAALESAFEA